MALENQNTILDSDDYNPNYYIEDQTIISLNKFIILYIITIGLYGVWWIYKAWRFFKFKVDPTIKPAVRTIFSIIYFYSLLQAIKAYAEEKEYPYSYTSGSLFVGFFLFNFLSYLPDPYWFISIFGFIFLIPAFNALNFAKRKSDEFKIIEEVSYNHRQIALVGVGTIFWLILLVSYFL